MKNKKHNFGIMDITLVGVLAALVFASSMISIPFLTSRIHLGNVLCILAGLILRPVSGGLAAGIGSLIYDLLHGYGVSSLITFISKFAMAFVTSFVLRFLFFKKNNAIFHIALSGILGEIAYILLYMLKTFIQQKFIFGLNGAPLLAILYGKLSASILNAVISIIIATIVFRIIQNKIEIEK